MKPITYRIKDHVHAELRESAGEFTGELEAGEVTPSDDVPAWVLDYLVGIGAAEIVGRTKGPEAPETVEA